jgi:CheY-like chemotaxis protein
MPKEDSHSLMSHIWRLDPRDGDETPAIDLTAYAETSDREAAFASGFQECRNKLVDTRTLTDSNLDRPLISSINYTLVALLICKFLPESVRYSDQSRPNKGTEQPKYKHPTNYTDKYS